jgi:thiosulfate/3-mercaptopyruvate sulfurtransferase
MASTGLHQTLAGYYTILEQRGADFSDPHMQEGFDNHCSTCHASCGQCHISRPSFTGGGLLSDHKVKEFASMSNTCMACHGARVANEYKGLNEGVPGSVHWLEEGMPCYECHEIDEFHGQGLETENSHRYDGPPSPDCAGCHAEATPGESSRLEHNLHWNKVSCNV